MFARSFSSMTVTGLIALFLISNKPIYSVYHSTQSGRQPGQQAQPPQAVKASKSLRIFIEEDFSSAQILKRDLGAWSRKINVPIVFVDKDSGPYDLRIILASGSGKDSGYCSTDLSCAPSSCEVTIKLFFVSATALTPDGKLQFTEIGVGNSKIKPITPLATKLAKRFSVISGAKVTSTR